MAYYSDGFRDFATGVKENERKAVVVSDPVGARLSDGGGSRTKQMPESLLNELTDFVSRSKGSS